MSALTHDPEDVILRDGTTLRLRPPLAADAEAVLDFFTRLSDRSRYLRFHGFPNLSPKLVASFVEPDWDERGALVGCLEGRVVALANYARLRNRRAAEVAFTVDDEHQGRGIGTRLLERLVALAAEAGIEEFVAEVLPENRPMLLVFRDAGFDIVRELDGGAVEVRFPIATTAHYRDRVAERNHVAVTASLKGFFEPSCVAVIGASARRGSIGGELFRNVLAGDFTGAAYPVNRGGEPVAGVHGYASVGDIPDQVELAVICLPGEHVLGAAQEALEAGVRALCVISAGFAETGSEGLRRQERLVELAREHGARVVGPNCLGIASAAVRLNATFAPRAFPVGNIGFSSQSGALGLAVLERAEASGLGLSAFVSIGNKADVSSNDLLEWWEDDPATEIVLLYLESFGNPRAFARIARRVARTKPILAVKGGTTHAGSKAASSHTAALAGSESAVDALFHQAGVIRTRTLDELVEVASLLSAQPVPRGRRVALVTNAGGLGILCADACEAAGLELPTLAESTRHALAGAMPTEGSSANPVDMLGSANAKSFREVLPIVLADPGIDAVIVLFVPTVGVDEDEVGAAISGAATGAGDKTVLCAFLSAKGAPASLRSAAQVPSFSYPEAAARALGRAAERGDWLRRPPGTTPELDVDRAAAEAVVADALGAADEAWLAPAEARALLEAYGLPVVPERVAGSPDEACAAARELGFPVVVKSAAAGAHKTDSGGVALNLTDEAEVRAAAERIGSPVIVQPMVAGGAELLAGAVQDPVFGPLVAFGPGGVLAELIGQAQFRLAPLTDLDARDLVRGGKAGRLVAGFRGTPPADEEALVDLLLRLAKLTDDIPEVAELDLNPVLALADRCVCVDARGGRAATPPRDDEDLVKERAMRIADVMTTKVLTVTPETSLKGVAELLAARGISGLPVVDGDGCVLGVVSEADILQKERRYTQPTKLHRMLHRTDGADAKRNATTAAQAMTSPAVTVKGSRRVDVAASLMLDRQVNRLPVVDEQGVLVGIVTRADLVRAFVHTDEEIVREIRDEVLLHELWLRPEDFELTVTRGEVAVSGHFATEDERDLLIRRVSLVPGVVSIEVHETTEV